MARQGDTFHEVHRGLDLGHQQTDSCRMVAVLRSRQGSGAGRGASHPIDLGAGAAASRLTEWKRARRTRTNATRLPALPMYHYLLSYNASTNFPRANDQCIHSWSKNGREGSKGVLASNISERAAVVFGAR